MYFFYQINITETSFNKSYYYDVPTNSMNLTQALKIKMHDGGKYRITVKTYLNDSRESAHVLINGPEIPSPVMFNYFSGDSSFFWKNAKNISHDLLKNP